MFGSQSQARLAPQLHPMIHLYNVLPSSLDYLFVDWLGIRRVARGYPLGVIERKDGHREDHPVAVGQQRYSLTILVLD